MKLTVTDSNEKALIYNLVAVSQHHRLKLRGYSKNNPKASQKKSLLNNNEAIS